MKNSIFRKSSFVKSNFKKKKKNVELEFYVKFLTLLDFHQIEFQSRGILQDSFKTWGIFATSFGQKRQMLILATEFVLIV